MDYEHDSDCDILKPTIGLGQIWAGMYWKSVPAYISRKCDCHVSKKYKLIIELRRNLYRRIWNLEK